MILFDNKASTSSGTNVNTLAWNHTIGTGNERLLVVCAGVADTADTNISGITFNGVSMTKAKGQSSATIVVGAVVYYLINPPVGTYQVSMSITSSDQCYGVSASFYGIDQSNPLHTTAGGTAGTGAGNTNITTTVTQTLCIDSYSSNDEETSSPSNAGQYKLDSGPYSAEAYGASYRIELLAATYNFAWTLHDDYWAQAIAAFNASTAYNGQFNNYQHVDAPNGISVTEKIR